MTRRCRRTRPAGSRLRWLLLLPATWLTLACSSIDCPLDNVVVMTCGLYSAEDEARLTLADTLTVRTGGQRDSVLLNRAQGINEIQLPLHHAAAVDTLLLELSSASGQRAVDTLFVWHSNLPHFESIDCPTAMFHGLERVRWTSHALSLMPLTVDSVAIVRQMVDYDDVENLQIYLRSTTDVH